MEDERKKYLVANVLKFLQDEISSNQLNEEKKESVEVAIQCLETAYEIENDVKDNLEANGLVVDLVSLVKVPQVKAETSEEAKNQAEECKNRGNNAMKASDYNLAVEEYSKAIELNPTNAVYFCNRAAAYSRLEKHHDAIKDSKEAISLDPTYGKAYGRLGIAYSNLNMFDEARHAYTTALKYDPNNAMYETNLKLAEDRLYSTMENAAPPQHRPHDISQFINHPALINMATQMLSDPGFRNMMSGLMSMGNAGDPDFDALFQVGQTLANRMQTSNPNFVENYRRNLGELAGNTNGNPPSENNSQNPGENPEDGGKKD